MLLFCSSLGSNKRLVITIVILTLFFIGLQTVKFGFKDYLPHGLQNSRIFCERKRRGKYSNKRSGTSVETARENGERREKIRPSAMHILNSFKITRSSSNGKFPLV